MSTFALRLAGLLTASALTAGGSLWIYDRNSPKDLRELFARQGHQVASETNAFKAIMEEHKDVIIGFDKENFKNLDDIDNSSKNLQAWCEETLKLSPSVVTEDIKNKALKICIDSPKTTRGFLIRRGSTLIKENEVDDYKTTYALYRGKEEFSSWLGGIDKLKKIEEGYSKLKSKCAIELAKELNDTSKDDLSRTSWWCVIPDVRTIEDLLKKEDLSIYSESDGKQNIWQEQFEKWKETDVVIKAIKDSNSESNKDFSKSTPKEEAASKVKKWCEDSKSKKFSEEGVYSELYPQIRGVCTNYSPRK